MVRTDRPQMTI